MYGRILVERPTATKKQQVLLGVLQAKFAMVFFALPLFIVSCVWVPLWITEQPLDPKVIARNADWGETQTLQERAFPSLLHWHREPPNCLTQVSINFDNPAKTQWSREKLVAAVALSPWLQAVSIEGGSLTTDELRHFVGHARLREMHLLNTKVDPAGFDEFATRSLLHGLHIEGETTLSSELVAKFKHLKSLACPLKLSGSQVKLPPKIELLKLHFAASCTEVCLSESAQLKELDISQFASKSQVGAAVPSLRLTLRNLPLLQSIKGNGDGLLEIEANATPKLNDVSCFAQDRDKRDGSGGAVTSEHNFGLTKLSLSDCDKSLAIVARGNTFPEFALPEDVEKLAVTLFHDGLKTKIAGTLEHTLASLPHEKVISISIDNSVISANAANEIAQCHRLESLDLNSTQVEVADLVTTIGSGLRNLKAQRCGVDQTAFDQILQLTPRLESLAISARQPLDIDLSKQALLQNVYILGVKEHRSVRLCGAVLKTLVLAERGGAARDPWAGEKLDISGAAVDRQLLDSICQHELADIRISGSSLSATDWQGCDFKSCHHLTLENERIGIAELHSLQFEGKPTSDSLWRLELHSIGAQPTEILDWVSSRFPDLKELRLDVAPWDETGSAVSEVESNPFAHSEVSLRGLSIDRKRIEALTQISNLDIVDMRNCEIDDAAIAAFETFVPGDSFFPRITIRLEGARYDASRLAEVLAKREALMVDIGGDPLPESLRHNSQVITLHLHEKIIRRNEALKHGISAGVGTTNQLVAHLL